MLLMKPTSLVTFLLLSIRDQLTMGTTQTDIECDLPVYDHDLQL